MRVLVTGGTGVVGHAAVTALLEEGHKVRLLSRHAERDARRWEARVEAFPGDVSKPSTLRGAADDCDAVLHVVGIVGDPPPGLTLDAVNVDGTRNIMAEAERARVRRFIFVSSLGADGGKSEYHRSKYRAEQAVKQFRGGWIIVRPGNVYGPGDDEISLLLRMVRTLPVVPVIAGGEQKFQPIWHEDLGRVLALAVERTDLHGRELDVAGPERTTQNDLLERLAALTDRDPIRLPLPGFLADIGSKLASAVGAPVPFNESQLVMLREGNVIDDPAHNALESVFGITPTTLDEGLKMLVDQQPEMLPERGVGAMHRKRIWGEIEGARHSAESLFERFVMSFDAVLPIETSAEPGTDSRLEPGRTLTMSLPVRGHIQVRVGEVDERQATLITLEGHPLAGAVRFLAEERGERLRFEVQVYDRAASVVDWVMMSTIGNLLQDSNWVEVVENMVDASGGRLAGEVHVERDTLDEEQTQRIEAWLEELVMALKREETESRTSPRAAAASDQHEDRASPT